MSNNENMDKVSIIIPIYNAEEHLERCVDTVLKQTYKNLEIILVNDGSTDASAEICLRIKALDDRVKYIYQENMGPDYARKKGLLCSTSPLLMFVDADDYIENNMVEKLYQKLLQYNCDIVCSQVKRVDTSGRIWNDNLKFNNDIICKSIREHMYYYFVKGFISGAYYGKLYRREMLDDYNFLQKSIIGEDITAVLHAVEKAKKICIVNDYYYYYYWNKNSISHGGYTDRHFNALLNYIKTRDELVEKDYIDSTAIIAYFLECEMAVVTAMSRSWNRDKIAIKVLRQDIKQHALEVFKNRRTPIYMKLSIALFYLSPFTFMFLYRILYIFTGR